MKDLFVVLFFVSIGSLINPTPAFALGASIILVFILVVFGKFVGGYTIGRLFIARNGNQNSQDVKMPSAGTFGARLVPRGEFSLLIAQLSTVVGSRRSNVFLTGWDDSDCHRHLIFNTPEVYRAQDCSVGTSVQREK